jgi:hypothetical protein
MSPVHLIEMSRVSLPLLAAAGVLSKDQKGVVAHFVAARLPKSVAK